MSGYSDIAKMENTRNCLRRIARHDEPQFSKDSIVNVMEKFVKTVNVMDDTILVPCRLMDRQVGDSTDILVTPGKDVTSNQHTQQQVPNGPSVAWKSKNVHEFLNSSELFNLYNMLNALKNDLLWTSKDDQGELEVDDNGKENLNASKVQETMMMTLNAEQQNDGKTENPAAGSSNNNNNSICSGVTSKGHARRPSTASVASIASVSQMSDSESDISQENDSGVELEGHKNGGGSADSTSSGSENGLIQTKKCASTDKATELAKRCRRHLNGLYQCLQQMTEAANYLTARYQSDIGGGNI